MGNLYDGHHVPLFYKIDCSFHILKTNFDTIHNEFRYLHRKKIYSHIMDSQP